ncbi:MAG: DUF2236 domain-containing protein [Alphaproteobacteria bacterium]|nr:DUF2236 domain-containing protein [Alphaproteobacteria bacterium]
MSCRLTGGPTNSAAGASGVVGEADLECEFEIFRNAAAENSSGPFGPSSMMWHIDKEAAIFLGAGRALLLQLAHPWIATAIAQHSRTLADPIGRFHRTFSAMFTMVFGTTAQALAVARRLHLRHARVSGILAEAAGPFAAGSRYEANDVAALRWVHATLIDTALTAYQLLCPPLSGEERERYWTEARLFAAFFGIPHDALPQSWADFAADNERMWRSDVLSVNDQARTIAGAILSGAGTWLPIPSWYRALTARLLPARLREEFELSYGEGEHRKTERALAVLRRLYPWVPARLRYVGPYQEACARLAGGKRPGVATQLLNRLWIGQKSMAG